MTMLPVDVLIQIALMANASVDQREAMGLTKETCDRMGIRWKLKVDLVFLEKRLAPLLYARSRAARTSASLVYDEASKALTIVSPVAVARFPTAHADKRVVMTFRNVRMQERVACLSDYSDASVHITCLHSLNRFAWAHTEEDARNFTNSRDRDAWKRDDTHELILAAQQTTRYWEYETIKYAVTGMFFSTISPTQKLLRDRKMVLYVHAGSREEAMNGYSLVCARTAK